MARRLDILIFGATGYTGMCCIPQVFKLSKQDGRNLTWGIAGRSEDKLKDVLKRMSTKMGADLSNTPIILGDVNDSSSLLKMAQETKVVINCCGPFRFLGEAVVKACIEAGTHHIDVSGEPQYMETIQINYAEKAKEKGVYVISACGFDSIPTDLGIVYVQQQFEGVLNSVVTYLELGSENKTNSGPAINYGTWASLIYSIVHMNELKDLRNKLYPTRLPTFTPKLEKRLLPHKSEVVKGWALPFLGADRSVAKRTQYYFYNNEDMRPTQVDTFFMVKSLFQAISFIIAATILLVLCRFKFGQKLLLNYPNIFSFGMFEKDKQPSEEVTQKAWFKITLYGEGWKEKQTNKDDQYSTPPDKCILAKVTGKDPGYGSTCICLAAAAVTILTEKDKMPNKGKGGVYTPGVAFANTSLIELLNKNEVKFEIISQKDL